MSSSTGPVTGAGQVKSKSEDLKTAIPITPEDFAVALEKIADLEGKYDKLEARAKTAEGALFQVIAEFKAHSHNQLGQAVVPAAR